MQKISFILMLAIAILFSCKNGQKQSDQELLIYKNQVNDKESNLSYNTSYNPFDEDFRQYFYIENGKRTVIIGKQGTKITFPEDCFVTIPQKAKVELKEFYSLPDMIKGNLSTMTTDGYLLITGGMIYFNAYDENGDTLKLKKNVIIEMPTKNLDKSMKLFIGNDKESVIKWELIKQDLAFIDNVKETIVTNAPVDVLPPGVKHLDTINKNIPIEIVVKNDVNQKVTGLYRFSTRTTGYYNIDKYYLKEFEDKEKYRQMRVIDKTDRDDKFYRLIYKDIDAIDPLHFLRFSVSHTVHNADGYKFKVASTIETINLKILENHDVFLLIINKKENTTGIDYYYSLTSIHSKDTVHKIENLNKTTKTELDKFLEEKLGNNLWTRSKW